MHFALESGLDEEDFFCVITLAGAADGLLRSMFEEEYKFNPLDDEADFSAVLLSRMTGDVITKKQLIKGELSPVNWLKHYILGRGADPITQFFDEEDSAMATLQRAVLIYGRFVARFACELSVEAREEIFGSPEISRWEEENKDYLDGSIFS